MSQPAIPQLLSDSPPPIDIENENEDEFGNFYGNLDNSFDCNGLDFSSSNEELKESLEVFSHGLIIDDEIHVKTIKNIEISSCKEDKKTQLEYIENDVKSDECLNENVTFCEFKNDPNHLKNCDQVSEVYLNEDINIKPTVEVEIRKEEFSENDQINLDINNDKLLKQSRQNEIINENNLQDTELTIPDLNLSADITKNIIDTTGIQNKTMCLDSTLNSEVTKEQDEIESNDLKYEYNVGEFQWKNEEDLQWSQDICNDGQIVDDFYFNSEDKATLNVETELTTVPEDLKLSNDEDFGDFGSFTGHAFTTETSLNANLKTNSIAKAAEISLVNKIEFPCDGFEEDDEFDDFTSFVEPLPIQTLNNLKINTKNAFDHSKNVVDEVFPSTNLDINDYMVTSAFNNSVFENLKDITDTNALSFQWEKSLIQKKFLASLNIDSRNILYGHSWNLDLPVFASNLGMTPLEPIKHTEHILNQDVTNFNVREQVTWNSSKAASQVFVAPDSDKKKLDLTSTATTSTNIEMVGNTMSVTESILFQPTISGPRASLDASPSDLSDDKFFNKDINLPLSTTQGSLTVTMYPLKESYITINDKNDEFCHFTDSLPSDISLNDLNINSGEHTNASNLNVVQNIEPPILKPVVFEYDYSKVPSKEIMTENMPIDENKDHITDESVSKNNAFEEDDFTDFVSCSLMAPSDQLSQPLQPILTPTPIQPIASTKIEWPNPGLDENDINNFISSFSSLKTENIEQLNGADVNSLSTETVKTDFKHILKDNSNFILTEDKLGQSSSSFINKETLQATSDLQTLSVQNITSIKQSTALNRTLLHENCQNNDENEEWSDFVSIKQPEKLHDTSKKKSLNGFDDIFTPINTGHHDADQYSNISNGHLHKNDPGVQNYCSPMDNHFQKKINSTVGQMYTNMRSAYTNSFSQPSSTHLNNSFKTTVKDNVSDIASVFSSEIQKSDDEWGDFVTGTSSSNYSQLQVGDLSLVENLSQFNSSQSTFNGSSHIPDLEFVNPRSRNIFK